MNEVEVAVVGAGAAGLAAAAMLRAAGVGALLLEARARTGGRAHTDLSDPAAPFDRGASFIHAADQGNPWLDLALACGEPLVLDPRRRAIRAGGRALPAGPYEQAIASAFRHLGRAAAAGTATSAAACLPRRTAAQRHARALVGPWLSGVDSDRVDVRDFVAARDGEDWLLPNGYGRLVARFGAGLPVRLDCPVTALRQRPGGVELVTPQGTLRAGRVVLTVPLGVLAAERIRFDPPLPEAVRAAIADLPMGNLVKLRVRLEGDVAGAGDHVYLAAPPADERSVLWLARPFGRDELMGFVGGSLAAELTALAPPDLAAAVRAMLAALLGGAAAGRVRDCVAADWRADPWALGSYAIARPGAAIAARAVLRRPFAEGIVYAGEAAAADGWHGTVAGAHLSGRAAARSLLGSAGCRGPVTI
jgi:monoamine oxidase